MQGTATQQIEEPGMVGITTQVFEEFWDAFLSKIYNVFVLEGGSRSSKTHSIIQFWILWAYTNMGKGDKRVIVARLKSTWLKATVVKDFIDVLKFYGLYDENDYNKSERIYKLFDTEFWFVGLDDPQRIHGLQSDAFWINEAIEAHKDDYDQLMQRCKGFAVLDYNPSEEEHWIYDALLKRKRTWYNHSTMLKNPLIPKNAKEQILSYEPTEENYAAGTADKRKWEIYGLGKRAKLEGLVFENYELIDEIPARVKRRVRGLDLGYSNDVTAAVDIGIDIPNNAIYIDELCYNTKMLTGDIIKVLRDLTSKVWCDNADPRLIDEVYNAGIDIEATEKGPGSIKAGLDKMKGMRICITMRSFNIIKEFKNYTYKQDKNGKFLNEPIDLFNHAIDAIRYVVLMEILGKRKKAKDLSGYLP